MLDEKDLQAIAGLIDTRAVQTEELIDIRAKKNETKIEKLINTRITQSENLILDELSRTRNILEDKIETVKRNMDELSQYYRITKLESDNTSLLLQMIVKLEKEFEEFKQRTA